MVKSERGIITRTTTVFDSLSGTFQNDLLFYDHDIYFRDSLVIQPAWETHIVEDENGIQTVSRNIYQYTFLDLKNLSFYDYETFSDTASLLKKYTNSDTARREGWNFYAKNVYYEPLDKSQPLPDTLVNGIKYKRYTWTEYDDNPIRSTEYIAYLDCNRKTMFQLNKLFGDKIGCPIVMLDQIIISTVRLLVRDEIIFKADTLSAYEQKVFDAWEKYAKEHPVKE